MSKITVKQFLDHLGVEDGQEFTCNKIGSGKKFRIKGLTVEYANIGYNDWTHFYQGLGAFIEKEVTPIPKYTLLEDAKAVVRCLADYECIRRDKSGEIWFINDTKKLYHCSPMFNHLFPFIKSQEEVDLEELRKLL